MVQECADESAASEVMDALTRERSAVAAMWTYDGRKPSGCFWLTIS
jgi:hypothetical protein